MADAEIPAGNLPRKKNADLPVRFFSAMGMMAVAILALWAGGVWLDLFIAVVAALTFWEFSRLIRAIVKGGARQLAALLAGALYIGGAAFVLIRISSPDTLVLIVGTVIFVDTFAYAFGRTIGGPKIAPSISPSKTWAGLMGGVVGATLAILLWQEFSDYGANVTYRPAFEYFALLLPGAIVAVLAQAGDFFESWLKRKAGVKDSSNLIPGHGGVFDRTDGLLPVAWFFGAVFAATAPHWIAG